MSPDKRLSDSNTLCNGMHTFVGRCYMRLHVDTTAATSITEDSSDSRLAISHLP
jgi:hypothetical protein